MRRVGLAVAICFWGARLPAQQPATPPANTATQQPAPAVNAGPLGATNLKILVLEGEGAVNNVTAPMPMDLVVEVRDQNDRPVEGAMVSFQLPLMGASGAFDGGVRNKDGITNVQGQASATFIPNMEVGRLTIQVKAAIGGLTGMTAITERNATEKEQGKKKSWLRRHRTLVIIAATVTVGVVLAVVLTGGSSSSSSTTSSGTITITPGVPTVGGP